MTDYLGGNIGMWLFWGIMLIGIISQATAFVDGNAQAKTMLPFGGMAQVQQVAISPRICSFVPYYHKVYEVYLQIIW